MMSARSVGQEETSIDRKKTGRKGRYQKNGE
jgi:hypothetical protein